jgi:hypothetical protein
MSTPATPSSPNPAGDDRNLVAVDAATAATFEDKLQLFWNKNRTIVLGLCGLVLVGIIAKGGLDYLAAQKNIEVGNAYAAATTPEQLKAFAAANSSHVLGGIAQLRMADDAYAAGKSADAVAGYDKALAVLKDGPLVARAKLGLALAKVQAGKGAEAATELKQLADDAKLLKAVRAEAAFHLTGLAVESGNAAEAQKYVDQLNTLDPMGPWSQRAVSLRATLPATPAPAAPKTDAAAPAVQVKVPGK